MQKAPFHQSHVYGRIKLSPTIFEKGHPRKILVKLFQNLTSGFREEDFLRISLCLYSARSPHSPEPCLRTDQNFAKNFSKGSPKEQSCEIILKSDQRFQSRFFKNFLPEPCPWTDQNLANISSKGSPNENSCEIISKSDKLFQRFLKNCLKNSIWLPWQSEFLMESNYENNFREDLPRNIPAKFGPNWPSGLGGEDV